MTNCRTDTPSRFCAGRGWLTLIVLAGLAAALTWTAVASGAEDKGEAQAKLDLSADLAWAPPDAVLFVQLRPADIWNSEPGKDLRRRFGKDLRQMADDVEKSLAAPPSEIDRVVYVTRSLHGAVGLGAGEKAPAAQAVEKPEAKGEKKASPPPQKQESGPKDDPGREQPPPPKKEGPPDHEADERGSGLVIVTMTNPATLKQLQKQVAETGMERKHKGKVFYEVLGGDAVYFANERTYVKGSIAEIKEGLQRIGRNSTPAPLAPVLRAALGKHHLVAGMAVPKKEALSFVIALLSNLRESAADRALAPVASATMALLTADVGKASRADLELHFADEASARRGILAVQDGLTLLRVFGVGAAIARQEQMLAEATEAGEEAKYLFGMGVLEELESGLRAAKGEQQGTVLRFSARFNTDPASVESKLDALVKARQADPEVRRGRLRSKSANNLKQIGIALHNFGDTYRGNLPPAAMLSKASGKPLLSWRVAILPYIEQQNLYQQFKLDEPWDSPNNKKLLEHMPAIYAPVGLKTKEPYQTFYRGFVAAPGDQFQTAWQTRRDEQSPFGAWGARMPASFPDGTANTIWVVEAGEAVPWTKPDELVYDDKKPLPSLGGLFQGNFHALMVDATTMFVRRPYHERTLRDMITANDGTPVDPDRLTKGRK